MKIPKDSPTEVGQRVCLRGAPDRRGTIVRLVRQPSWMFIVWDEVGGAPGICHQNELKVIHERNPSPDQSA